MKTINEILKALNLSKSTQNNKIANNFLNLLKLVNELKKDITAVEVLPFNEILPGYRDECSEKNYNVFEVEFLRTIKIYTSFGSYEIAAPTNTNFYSYLCVILNIQSDYKEEVETYEIENTIYIENEIVETIAKAVKFTNVKSLFDLAQNVYLRFKNDKVELISTTGPALYKSKQFNYISDKIIDNFILSIPACEVLSFKGSKNEFLQIDLIDNEFILINGQKIKINSIDATQINNFNFEVDQSMEFTKLDIQKSLKSLSGFVDYRNLIKFHLNGSIEMQPLNVEKNNTSIKVDYISKNFGDIDLILNHKNTIDALSIFKAKNITLAPQQIGSKTVVLLTDSLDSVLLVSQNHLT